MRLIRYPQYLALTKPSCVTIGNFDGVHIGHQALIGQVVQKAKQSGCQSVVVTMSPLPLQYFQGESSVQILTPLKQKFLLIQELGVDVLCVLNFNARLAAMSAAEFYQQVILEGLLAQCIVVGDDFKFGARRLGDYELLKQLASKDGVDVIQMGSIKCVEGPVEDLRVSSTAVRDALIAADFQSAKSMLGREFSVVGRVAHGQKLGRSLGFPTINIELKSGAFSLHGIYVAALKLKGKMYRAVASVGYNPSVGGNAKRIEVYVLDFDRQVYGQCVEVLFYKKLRNEVKFDDLTTLTAAIKNDVRLTREFFE